MKTRVRRKLKENERQLTIIQRVDKRIFVSPTPTKPMNRALLEMLRDDLVEIAGRMYHEKYHTENLSDCESGCKAGELLGEVFPEVH